MASDPAVGGRIPGRRAGVPGFRWIASSPSPAVVAQLVDSFPEVVRLPVAELEAEAADWQSTTIIAQSFHKWVPAEALIREFRRAGVPGEIFPINLASRCHLFRFESLEVRNQVLHRPWMVNGQVIGTEEWRPEFTPAEDSIKTALVWVRLPNLPLEFWKDGFIKQILETAGSFVSVDAATLAKNRGGFARACIRVDFTRPLRPGVRVQGLYHPFWQPFVYECLEGICMRCGMLHLGGPCSALEKVSGDCSASIPDFGPWLIAVRQRKPASGPLVGDKGAVQAKSPSAASGSPSDSKKKQPATSSGNADLDVGWSSPVKLARRRSSSARKSVVIHGGGSDQAEGITEVDAQRKDAVPVTVWSAGVDSFTAAETAGDKGNCLNIPVKSKNPFASLVPAVDVEGSKVSRDTFPGPVKRARPEVSVAPRSFSKLDKRKGKVKAHSSKEGRLISLSPGQMGLSPCIQDVGQEVVRAPSTNFAGLSSEYAVGIKEGLVQGSSYVVQPSSSFETGCGSEDQAVRPVIMSDIDPSMKGEIADSTMMEDQGGPSLL